MIEIGKQITPESFIEQFNTFLIDLDGVIWKGDNIIPGVKESIDYIRNMNKRILFITNNSSKGTTDIYNKLKKLELIEDIKELISSVTLIIHYLKNKIGLNKKIYVIGTKELKEDLNLYGGYSSSYDSLSDEIIDEISAIVVGYSFDFTNEIDNIYKIANKKKTNIEFIATSYESLYILGIDSATFGTGCIVAFFEHFLNLKCTIVGKPSKYVFEMINERLGTNVNSNTCIIGDGMRSDIAFGHKFNIKTLLVESGTDTRESVSNFDFYPNYIATSIAIIGKKKKVPTATLR